MKSKEEELCYVFEQLSDSSNRLCVDMKRKRPEFTSDPCTSHHVQKQKCESIKAQLDRETLSCKFKIVCEKLQETKTAFDEAKNIINNDIFNIKNTASTFAKMTGVGHCSPQKMICQIQQLIEENGVKDEEIYCMNKKIKKLQKENEYNVLKINKLKKTVANHPESKYKVENIKILEKNPNRFKQDHECACLKRRLNNMYPSF